MWQLTIFTIQEELPAIEAMLDQQEPTSISVLNAGDDVIIEQELHEIPSWSKIKIEATFTEENLAKTTMQQLIQANLGTNLDCSPLKECNWLLYSLKDFLPIEINKRLWIYPYWLLPEQVQEPYLLLDPGFAFGTGQHPTTQMCLEWLTQHPLQHKTILDYGCGSGILAIAALKLGADTAYGIDIDPQACEASRHNAVLNQIPEHQLIIDTQPLSCNTTIDILMANIVMNPLLEGRDYFYKILQHSPDTRLILSGLLMSQCPQVKQHYQTHFDLLEQKQNTEWGCLVFAPKHPAKQDEN